MPYVIKAYGPTNSIVVINGEYLKSYDVEAHGGQGAATFTMDISEALTFDTAAAAMEFSMQQSQTRPLRFNGEPNRPLKRFDLIFVEK